MHSVEFTDQALKQMYEFGQTNKTEEICALLIGEKIPGGGGNIHYVCSEVRPIENVLHDPVRYEFNPQQFFDELQDTSYFERSNTLDFIGVYHTHPNHHPIPSMIDLTESGYAGVYVIYSPKYDTYGYYHVTKAKEAWSSINVEHLKEIA